MWNVIKSISRKAHANYSSIYSPKRVQTSNVIHSQSATHYECRSIRGSFDDKRFTFTDEVSPDAWGRQSGWLKSQLLCALLLKFMNKTSRATRRWLRSMSCKSDVSHWLVSLPSLSTISGQRKRRACLEFWICRQIGFYQNKCWISSKRVKMQDDLRIILKVTNM